MSRHKSENRDKAFRLWVKSGRTRDSASIARELGISPGLVRKWKYLDAWDAKPSPGKGAPKGNKNAVGNKGGSAPPGNRNAYKNGNYESMWLSQIAVEHKVKLMKVETDPRQILLNEITLLDYREFLMMKNMKEIDEGLDKLSIERRYEYYQEEDGDAEGAETLKFVDGVPKFQPAIVERKRIVEEKTKEPQKLERILQIHNALTAVQGRKIKCISLLDQFDRNELTVEELKLRIERMQLEVNKLRTETW